LVAELAGANSGFAYVPLTGAAKQALKPGKNLLAVHCHQTRGGQFVDAEIVNVIDVPSTPASRRPGAANR
jgi:hypothetical protein